MEIRNLKHSYPDSSAILNGVNFTLNESEIILINGKSGSGKSTLLNLIYGLIDIQNDDAKIILDAEEIQALPLKDRVKKISYVFQDIDLQLCTNTVLAEIRFGLENLGLDESEIEERTDQFLSLADLNFRRNQTVSSLSGGQKQKLIIVSILALKPKLILMDEPFAQLDVKSAHELVLFIDKVSKDYGTSFVICEHRTHFFEEIDTINFTLSDGKLIPFKKTVEEFIVNTDSFLTQKTPFLRLDKLTISLKNNYKIIDDLDLSIYKGERLAVLGKNGTGKSALFQAVAGLLKYSGTIVFEAKLALLFQNPDLMLTKFKVKDEVSKPELLDILDLKEQAEQHPLTLSKGQRLRTAFGQIMSRETNLLIMDEPTSGQDISHINQILNYLRTKEDLTILCSSHDIDFIFAFASRIIVLDKGKIIFDEANQNQKDRILDLLKN